jgi:predicted nucleic acid-binding protein
VDEPPAAEAERVRRLLTQGLPATSRFSQIEVTSALARRSREGAISAADRDRAMAAVVADFAALNVVELSPEVAALAGRLLARHPLRAGDALQLASALLLARRVGGRVEWIACDQRLAEAAAREGLSSPA